MGLERGRSWLMLLATGLLAVPAIADCVVMEEGSTLFGMQCVPQNSCWTAPACTPVTVKSILYDYEELKVFIEHDADCIMVISTTPPCTITTEQWFARKHSDRAWGLCGSAWPNDTCSGGSGICAYLALYADYGDCIDDPEMRDYGYLQPYYRCRCLSVTEGALGVVGDSELCW